jgi:hypothetical protein
VSLPSNRKIRSHSVKQASRALSASRVWQTVKDGAERDLQALDELPAEVRAALANARNRMPAVKVLEIWQRGHFSASDLVEAVRQADKQLDQDNK